MHLQYLQRRTPGRDACALFAVPPPSINAIVWLCDKEPVKTFQKGPPPERAKPNRWWTYIIQLRLTVRHKQGSKVGLADYILRNNLYALLGEKSESLAKDALQRMDVQLDLSRQVCSRAGD